MDRSRTNPDLFNSGCHYLSYFPQTSVETTREVVSVYTWFPFYTNSTRKVGKETTVTSYIGRPIPIKESYTMIVPSLLIEKETSLQFPDHTIDTRPMVSLLVPFT